MNRKERKDMRKREKDRSKLLQKLFIGCLTLMLDLLFSLVRASVNTMNIVLPFYLMGVKTIKLRV